MNFLNRIPFWGWFLIIAALLYGLWNPMGYSLYDMWAYGDANVNLPPKLLLTFLMLVLIGLLFYSTRKSIGLLGVVVTASLLVLIIWCFTYYELLAWNNVAFWAWALQPMVALVLTIGLLWRKVVQSVTGIRGVSQVDNVHLHANDEVTVGVEVSDDRH